MQDVDPEALHRQSSHMRKAGNVPIAKYSIEEDPIFSRAAYMPNKIPLYMPNKLQIDTLERDINCIFEQKYVEDSSNYVDESYTEDDYSKPIMHPDQLILNNIKKQETTEFVEEHIVIVDSSDRNLDKYPNPFNYRVYFNSQYNDANIQRVFENVKSIKLETGVLPSKYFFIKTNISLHPDDIIVVQSLELSSRNTVFSLPYLDASRNFVVIDVTDTLINGKYSRNIRFAPETAYPLIIDKVYEYIFDFDRISNSQFVNPIFPQYVQKYTLQSYTLERNKFNLLYVDEFEYVNRYSTNDPVSKSFAVLFTESKCNHSHYVTTKLKEKEFKSHSLATVNRLSISLRDYTGEQLKCSVDSSYFDTSVPRIKTCTCTIDTNGVFKRDYRCSCSYFRHPLYHHFQNTLMFKITTWEQDIAKEIF